MKPSFFVTICLTLVLFLASGCKKNQAGGPSEISGTVVHHEKPIPHATVYIKFNATEWPGRDSSVYDHQVKADAAGKFVFRCYRGSYYLYGTGVEPRATPLYVNGGIPVTLRHNEKKDVQLAVTEKH